VPWDTWLSALGRLAGAPEYLHLSLNHHVIPFRSVVFADYPRTGSWAKGQSSTRHPTRWRRLARCRRHDTAETLVSTDCAIEHLVSCFLTPRRCTGVPVSLAQSLRHTFVRRTFHSLPSDRISPPPPLACVSLLSRTVSCLRLHKSFHFTLGPDLDVVILSLTRSQPSL
jgi:hypothetical protein